MRATVVIGTRGSKLALWQADAVRNALTCSFPDLNVAIKKISTSGDRIIARSLMSFGDKGVFTKELESALMDGEVDLCVHSMKDLPGRLPAGFTLAAMLPRADVRDALVYGSGEAQSTALEDLPLGTRIGTSSLRRTAQLKAHFPNIEPCDIRGNVETRVEKALGAGYGGAILAAAGLERLGIQSCISSYIEPDVMVPAPGQGAIGIEIREGDEELIKLCGVLNDSHTWNAVAAEREIAERMNGGCTAPLGVHTYTDEGRWNLIAIALSPDGSDSCRVNLEADDDSEDSLRRLTEEAVSELESQGAAQLLRDAVGKRDAL